MFKSIAVFDIDNTIYDGFSYIALLEKHVSEHIIGGQVLDDATISLEKYASKLQDYEATIVELLDIYAAGLRGKRYEEVLLSTKEFYRGSTKFFAYVQPTLQALRYSHEIALVTGEPQFVADAVCGLFEIPTYYSTRYEVIDGVFTGEVQAYLASRHEKHSAIRHLMTRHGSKNSFAFGDSEGDIEMLRAAEHRICLNPTAGLRSIAVKEGWHVPNLDEVPALVRELNTSCGDS